jgi:hypothetical protein
MTQFSLSISPDGQTLAVTMSEISVTPSDPNGQVTGYGVGLIPVAGGELDLLPGYTAAAFAPTGTTMCAQTSNGALVTLTPSDVASAPIVASGNPTACAWVP